MNHKCTMLTCWIVVEILHYCKFWSGSRMGCGGQSQPRHTLGNPHQLMLSSAIQSTTSRHQARLLPGDLPDQVWDHHGQHGQEHWALGPTYGRVQSLRPLRRRLHLHHHPAGVHVQGEKGQGNKWYRVKSSGRWVEAIWDALTLRLFRTHGHWDYLGHNWDYLGHTDIDMKTSLDTIVNIDLDVHRIAAKCFHERSLLLQLHDGRGKNRKEYSWYFLV